MVKKMTFDPKEVARVIIRDSRELQNLTIQSIDVSPDPIINILTAEYKMEAVEAAEVADEFKSLVSKSKLFHPSKDGRHFEFKSNNKGSSSNYKRLQDWKTRAGKSLVSTFSKGRFISRKTKKFKSPSETLTYAHGGGVDRQQGQGYSAATTRPYAALRLIYEAGDKKAFDFLSQLMTESDHPFINEIRVDYMLGLTTAKGRISKKHVTWLGFESPSDQWENSDWEKKETKRIEVGLLNYLRKYALDNAGKEYLEELDRVIDTSKAKRRATRLSRKPQSVRVKNSKKTRTRKRNLGAVVRLKNAKGQFTSAMNIQAILDQRIKQQVQDNMGEGGALVNRTGRFAESVSVTKVMQSRQGTLTAFYTYMKAPYQTFERGYAQGTARRDPRKLIAASIREIARETLSHKLQIRTRRV
jgi:hypothetical protein